LFRVPQQKGFEVLPSIVLFERAMAWFMVNKPTGAQHCPGKI